MITIILILCSVSHAMPNLTAHTETSSLAATGPNDNSESGCDGWQVPPITSKTSQNDFKRWQAERAFGKKLADDMEQKNQLIADDFTVSYLNRLEQKLVASSKLRGCFVVKVIHDPDPNAYSLPGGFIYVTSGLIQIADSESELVAALAHETGHITGRHLTRLDSQMHVWGNIASLAGPVGYATRRYLGPLLVLKLVRNKEFEADRLGLQYHIASGYDPNEFCRLLEVVFPDGENESFINRLYEPHPSTSSRIERLRSALARAKVRSDYVVDSSSFAEMKLHLAAWIATEETE